jgi:arylsulfatase A-like enzyme
MHGARARSIGKYLALLFLALLVPPIARGAESPPNLVFILTDNHGEWSLGCYGNPDIKTPNIDRLAEKGTLFEKTFANNAVCSPTRATLMTGLMASQHGVHSFLAAGRVQISDRAYYTLEEFQTLPSLLVDAGYTAGLCGKWHLGENLKPQKGFTEWVTKPHGHTTGFYDQEVVENGKVRIEPEYLTDFWTDRAVNFIEKNQSKPFFLYLAYNGPYGIGQCMHEPIKNRFAEVYGNQSLPSFPRGESQPWNVNKKWIGDLAAIRKYAAEVSGVDDGVGRIVSTLDKLGLTEKTLIVFTADQGTACGHAGYWGMGDHSRPRSIFDWTLSVPLIISNPKLVKSGQRVPEQVSNYDIYPTLLSLLGLKRTAGGDPLPGRDLSPFLRGERPEWEQAHFIDYQNLRGIRTAKWKYIERFKEEPPRELYNLSADSVEHHNLADDPAHQQTIVELKKQMDKFFQKHANPKWDLWKDGQSKSELTAKVFGQDRQWFPDGKPAPRGRANVNAPAN